MYLSKFFPKLSIFGFLYLILVFIIYSNSFHSSWHLDDDPNIRDNKNIHITSLSWDTLTTAMYNPNGKIQRVHRPVARLSFGINWYFGQDKVFGYHLVNFFIHVIAGLTLYSVILLLFQSPVLIKYDRKTAYFVAALTASLWAIHPIQVPAVTYIVQRMASLAGLFYIVSLFFYLKARLSEKKVRVLYVCLSCLAYLFAVGSKQNAVMLPGSVLLIELIFFQRQITMLKKRLFYLGGCLFSLLLILLLSGNQISILESLYDQRAFTMTQRLLTESRVLFFYISQLFFPVESRFSIEHSFTLSNSLIDPWTTLLSVLCIFILFGGALINAKRFPILSFAILFFFLNHIVESTILPLEILFEHRNYIPSMFVFFPVVMGLYLLISTFKEKNKFIWTLLYLFITTFLIATGLATYARNITWQTDETLWKDAMAKAPDNSRPLQNYSASLIRNIGKNSKESIEQLFEFNKKALEKTPSGTPSRMKRISFTNMASSLAMQEKFSEALVYYDSLLELYPDFDEIKFHVAKLHIVLRQNKKALDMVSTITSNKEDYQNMHALALLKNQKPDQALEILSRIRKNSNQDRMLTLIHLAAAYKQKKEFKKARHYLDAAIRKYPNQMVCYLFMIDLSGQMGDTESQKQTGKELFEKWPMGKIFKTIETMKKENLQPDIPFEKLISFLEELILEYYAEFKDGLQKG